MIACDVSYTYPTRGLTLRMVPSIPGQVHRAFLLPPSGSLDLGRVPGHFSRRGAGSPRPPALPPRKRPVEGLLGVAAPPG